LGTPPNIRIEFKKVARCHALEEQGAAAKRGVVVDRQVERRFWEGRTVRPDIVVHVGDKRFVIDTKWKELSSPHPSEEDLRQMFTYNHIIDSTHSFLVYPDIHGVAGRDGLFENQMAGAKNHGCATYFVKVWRDVKGAVVFNAALGEEILERVVAA